ncbi:MAG: hypothetical protein LBB75_04820 [Oscillospiraceae bacterium]|nr:hypothetical protein [Oscillospiraceae bacterium]
MKIDIADHGCTIQWGGVYYFALSDYPRISAWELHKLARFAQYERANGRRPRLKCKHSGLRRAAKAALREPELVPEAVPPVKITECTACNHGGCLTDLLCHGSSVEDAKSIFSCGELRSAARARGLPHALLAKEPRNGAGDPPDYFDYVMFAWGNCQSGDSLVMERQLGRFPTQEEFDHPFTRSVRFYFRYESLKAHPGFLFDGYHAAKIRDALDLRAHLAACVVPGHAWDSLASFIPDALLHRVHCLAEEGETVLDWSEKCYDFVREVLPCSTA